jgi:hypothetical protein
MKRNTFLNLFCSYCTFLLLAHRISIAILTLIIFSSEVSFAQIQDIFKQINGVAIWGSLGGFHHDEIYTRQIIFPRTSLRYGVELFLGPYPDSHKTATPKYEFGLGVNFADGYRTNIGGLEVRMPIRIIYLAAYLEFQKKDWLLGESPYIGATAGINIDLKGTALNATDANNQFELTGNTIPIEILIGNSWKLAEGFQIFSEVSYEYLAFDGVMFKSLGTSALPTIRPQRIDLSSWHITLGFQFAR